MEKNNSSETLADFINLIDSKISEIKLDLKIPSQVAEILDADVQERYKWDSQKCAQAALDLVKYLGYIRSKLSKNNNMIRWLNHHLKNMHGKYILSTGEVSTTGQNYTPYELRYKMLNAENEKCIYLTRKILELESENEELSTHAGFINDFHYGLNSLARIKNT